MKKTLIGLIGLYVLLYLVPLNIRPLVVPDEMRYGEMAREMIHSGDWIVPRLNGLRYFEKPALGHVLNACSILLFGENGFGIRFASALAVGLAALAVFLLVRRERNERLALFASFIFLTFALVYMVGTFGTLDSMVSSFITLALCSFYAASTVATAKPRTLLLAGLGLFAGCAFLVKGFLVFAVLLLVIGPFLLWQRRWRDLWTMPWIPLLCVLAVCLPWSIMIALRESDFWRYFFWEEHVLRFFGGGAAQHAEPVWYFIPVLLVGAMPWTLIAPIPLHAVVRNRINDPLIRFCLLWLALPFLFFSVSSGKLATYILPCFPPLAILLACGISELYEAGQIRFFRVGAWILFSMLALVFGGLVLAGLLPVPAVKLYGAGELHNYVAALLAGGAAAGLAWMALRRKGFQKFIFFGLASGLLCAGIQMGIPAGISSSVGLGTFYKRQIPHLPEDSVLVVDSRTVHGACFVFQRDDAYVAGGMGELDYGLEYEDAQHRYLGTEPAAFLKLFNGRGDRPLAVAVRDGHINDLLPLLPEPVYRDTFGHLCFYLFSPANEKGTL